MAVTLSIETERIVAEKVISGAISVGCMQLAAAAVAAKLPTATATATATANCHWHPAS